MYEENLQKGKIGIIEENNFMEIAFVVLHYMAVEETYRCVEFIEKNIDTIDYGIVIVDNASPDGSGKILYEKFSQSEKVNVILNKENIGFARGNNVGYKYAKDKWNPRYIILLNNDVYLYEKSLLQKLDTEYENSTFYVLGPLIMTADGRCDINPDKAIFNSVDDIEKEIKKYEKLYRRYKYYYEYILAWIISISRAILVKQNPEKDHKNFLERAENVKLHGCFLVFSKEYISQYEGLDESTFLYWEEEFLYKHMLSEQRKTVYNPNIIVYHKEDASTNSSIAGGRKKKMFIYKNYINSLKELKKLFLYYESMEKV